MKPTTLLAEITAPQLLPQEYSHLKYILERDLSRNGVEVKIYGKKEV